MYFAWQCFRADDIFSNIWLLSKVRQGLPSVLLTVYYIYRISSNNSLGQLFEGKRSMDGVLI